MSQKIADVQFFFQPFTALEYKTDTPVLCIVFENQPDMILANSFPEAEKAREMFDKIRNRGDETVSIFGGSRNSIIVPLGVIYIRQPWRRRRGQLSWDIDGINFYRELWERVALAVNRVRGSGYTDFILVLPSKFRPDNIKNDKKQERRLEKFVRIISEAIVNANYSLDELIKNPSPLIKNVTITYFGEEDREVTNFFNRSIEDGHMIGEATGLVKQLTILPSNLKTPIQFVNRSTGAVFKPRSSRSKTWHVLKGHRFSSRTKISYLYGKEGIERFGFGLVHAVSRGSAHEPIFLKIHFRPSTNRQKIVKKIVLVGKGITFDTGGTNAKDDDNLQKMNYDMAGAAIVINLIGLAEKMNLAVELIALVPIAENTNGPESIRPGDVVKAYNKSTVEIVDTDAEGRLVIADSVSYSERHLKPDCTITIGTLGDLSDFAPDLISVGFGNDRLRSKILRAENTSAEKILLLPSIDHLNEVDNEHLGDISDLINWPKAGYYHSSPFIFIYNFFLQERPEWVFVDPGSLFEEGADNYGAGPGFGLKFMWYLIRQYV